MMRPVWFTAVLVAFLCLGARGDERPARPPNVVVILADDLGFSDLGCQGGEIDTPHLDRLAAGGLRFTQGYSTARCWPSRAALLTGYYPQAIRRDALPGGKGGAQGTRPEWARLLPELIAAAGYRSYHSGKWHVDGDPLKNGFARSLDAGAAGQNNYFDAAGLTAEGRPLADRAGFYATAAIGDHAVACLAEHARDHAGKPFFHYVAFTAPHFPLQAPADLVAKYRERYRAGWDNVRAARCRRVRELGIVTTAPAEPETEVGPPYPPPAETLARLGPGEVDRPRPWGALTAEQRDFQADKMAIHAAMVEALDREVGRIVAQLEAMEAFDDTLILFASDNGASAEILIRGAGHDPAAEPGSRQTFLCLGPGWSTCANAPFRRHKTWVHEGGIATPWIVHWPQGVAARGELRRQPVHLVDVAPTVLEIAGVAPPRTIGGVAAPPMQGRSFAAALRDATAKPAHETLWWCHEGHRAVRAGDWKLVSARGRPWELYDLAADRCETTDLAPRDPERVRDLEATWNATAAECRALAAGERPNVVVILIDDLGYGDIGPFGATKQRTPRLDRMAAEGMKLTSFYAAPACSVSRAQLLTGCYGVRVSVPWVFFPAGPQGLAPAEVTLAERLRDLGYATACVGKWHLGDQPEFLPTRQGFDTYFGIPYSNDMQRVAAESGRQVVPLLRDERVEALLTNEEQREIVARYTDEAVGFIRANSDKPFFLYLPHTAVHAPLFPGRAVTGKSGNHAFGDWVEEVDWSVGRVLDTLAECGVDERTLVIFTSDNGPWTSVVGEFTSAGPLRGSKGSTWEGGVRVPTIARWPGRIAAGSTCDAMAGTIDLVPTCVALAGGRVPDEPVIDGRDISGLLLGTSTEPPRDTHAYFVGTDLQAVRQGRWKLVVAPQRDGMGRKGEAVPASFEAPRLYDLVADVGERTDVAADHPDVVERIRGIARAVAAELAGDDPPGRRPPGTVANPTTIYPTRPEPEREKKPAAAPAPPAARAPTLKRPNIIYVMTDDQGYGDVAAHGNPVIRTPHLDRLHATSVRLTEFHASPTCSPTRAALMTGRHEFRSGVTHTIHERERLALSATTLPQLLEASGYTTGIFGKWHLGDEDAYQPGKRGFDRVFIHGAGGIGQSYPGSCGDVPGNSYFDPVIRSDGEFVKTKGYCTDVFFAAALDWIDRCRTQDKPFFCYLTPNAPHDPLDCPPGSDEPYLAPLEAAGVADAKERARIAKFYGMIGNIDTNMGRLLEKLDEWGLAENTLVVFTTDNGTATGARVSNDGMRGRKGTPFRGGTRVPSFWRWRGSLPEGIDVPAVIAHIDVLPTLCEIAGAEIPPSVAAKVEGRSFAPLLRGARIGWPDRPLITHVGRWDRGAAAESAYRNCRIREGRWSLVNTKNRPDAWELHDLAADPGEQTDVARDHPDVVARLVATYDEWWKSVQPDLVNENVAVPPENSFAVAVRQRSAGDGRAPPAPGRPPNIVLVLCDDLGTGDVGALGSKDIQTPAIDRLFARGARLTRHWAGSAVCAPSRCVLLTGKHPGHAAVRSNREVEPEGQFPMPAGTATLAGILHEAGYATGGFGKWGLGAPGSASDPVACGFDVFFGYNCQREAHSFYPGHLWRGRERVPLDNPSLAGDPAVARGGVVPAAAAGDDAAFARFTGRHYAADLIAAEQLDFIRANAARPFFLYVPTTVPHLALQVPADEPSLAQYRRHFGAEEPYLGGKGYVPCRRPLATYAAMITRLDREVGRVVALLDELGIADDTIIVFTSDNGATRPGTGGIDTARLASNGMFRDWKGSPYEGGLRVPAVVVWPGRIPGGATIEAPTGFEDWLPTLLDLAGLGARIPVDGDGVSLAATLRGEAEAPAERMLYRELTEGAWQAVLGGRWKAVRRGGGAGRPARMRPTELYDLVADPGEQHDVADANPDVVRRLEALMNREHEPHPDWPLPFADEASRRAGREAAGS